MPENNDLTIRGYYKNPRKISAAGLEQLKENLLLLGDLSGIVHNELSNELIGGNQRGKIMDINSCDIEIIEQFDIPDKQGTIAWGFVVWEGQKYNYRKVRWSAAQCERANITANSLGGDWDEAILMAKWKDVDGIQDWGLPIVFDTPMFMDNDIDGGTNTNNKYHDVKAMVFMAVNLVQRQLDVPEGEAKLFLDAFEAMKLEGDNRVMKLFYALYQAARLNLGLELTSDPQPVFEDVVFTGADDLLGEIKAMKENGPEQEEELDPDAELAALENED